VKVKLFPRNKFFPLISFDRIYLSIANCGSKLGNKEGDKWLDSLVQSSYESAGGSSSFYTAMVYASRGRLKLNLTGRFWPIAAVDIIQKLSKNNYIMKNIISVFIACFFILSSYCQEKRPPIIDMHIHAHSIEEFKQRLPNISWHMQAGPMKLFVNGKI